MPDVRSGDIRIHYEIERSGPALVMQHGFTDSLASWHDNGYVDPLKRDCTWMSCGEVSGGNNGNSTTGVVVGVVPGGSTTLGVALRSSRIILKVPVSSGRSEKMRQTSPPLMAGRSLP